ncbi:MAG: hypothetical protein U5K79_14505 [Cyclobacteriaceae bacterium]|nr:hypothetical protein [Cyclobacteriaceae bacterium]
MKKETDVSKLIADLQLDEQKTERLRQILNGVLRDAFYTTLLGLTEKLKLENDKKLLKLKMENGNELTGGEDRKDTLGNIFTTTN